MKNQKVAFFMRWSFWQRKSLYFCRAKGEMAERSNAAVLKTVVPVTEPGVRIPLSPLIESLVFSR
jgi:hypothetical protein